MRGPDSHDTHRVALDYEIDLGVQQPQPLADMVGNGNLALQYNVHYLPDSHWEQ